MYNINDIIARLNEGEQADAIANEFADVLNQALKQVQEQRENALQERKKEKVMAVVDALAIYINEFHPNNPLNVVLKSNIDVVEVTQELDNVIGQLGAIAQTIPMIKQAPKPIEVSMDSPLGQFLRENGLLHKEDGLIYR